MATSPPERSTAWSCCLWRRAVTLVLAAVALGGRFFDLSSFTPPKDKPSDTKATASDSAVSPANVSEAQTHTARGQTLAKSGQTAEALEEFNQAVALDPYNAQALYGRALIRQANNQHELAIEDFAAASGLNPQKA